MHPVHGTKVAESAKEAEQDEKNGWVRFDPSSPLVSEKKLMGRSKKVKQEVILSEVDIDEVLAEVEVDPVDEEVDSDEEAESMGLD